MESKSKCSFELGLVQVISTTALHMHPHMPTLVLGGLPCLLRHWRCCSTSWCVSLFVSALIGCHTCMKKGIAMQS